VQAVAHVFVAALDDRCEITGPDGHHLQRVRRLTSGEIVTAADGTGAWRTYVVAEIGDHELTLVATAAAQQSPAPEWPISLAVALTKGGLEDVVTAVTELGVVRVTPVRTERVVVRWDETRARRAVERLRSVAREAAMQSRRARIPVIDDVAGFTEVSARPGLVVAAVDGISAFALPRPGGPSAEAGWTVLVGPEGGLAPDELAALADRPRLSLGPNVLRASTAPVAAAAVLATEAVRLRSE